jgi:hypothetical protein
MIYLLENFVIHPHAKATALFLKEILKWWLVVSNREHIKNNEEWKDVKVSLDESKEFFKECLGEEERKKRRKEVVPLYAENHRRKKAGEELISYPKNQKYFKKRALEDIIQTCNILLSSSLSKKITAILKSNIPSDICIGKFSQDIIEHWFGLARVGAGGTSHLTIGFLSSFVQRLKTNHQNISINRDDSFGISGKGNSCYLSSYKITHQAILVSSSKKKHKPRKKIPNYATNLTYPSTNQLPLFPINEFQKFTIHHIMGAALVQIAKRSKIYYQFFQPKEGKKEDEEDEEEDEEKDCIEENEGM